MQVNRKNVKAVLSALLFLSLIEMYLFFKVWNEIGLGKKEPIGNEDK